MHTTVKLPIGITLIFKRVEAMNFESATASLCSIIGQEVR